MGISMAIAENGDQVTIAVSGHFDFDLYDEFRASFANTKGNGVRYVVDLSATEHLDSSAIGMLLLLRDHAGGDASDVEIRGASDSVRKLLEVANFARLFNF